MTAPFGDFAARLAAFVPSFGDLAPELPAKGDNTRSTITVRYCLKIY